MMGALDFLSVGGASDGALAKSSMERAQRDAGARFEERDGWLVPVAHPGEEEHVASVGTADLSHLSKLEVRPAGLPDSLVTDCYKVWYDISPRRALVVCEAGQAAVVHKANRFGHKHIVAYVSGGPEEADLRRALKVVLPDYMIPQRITQLTALPRNANGKIDRRALTELAD